MKIYNVKDYNNYYFSIDLDYKYILDITTDLVEGGSCFLSSIKCKVDNSNLNAITDKDIEYIFEAIYSNKEENVLYRLLYEYKNVGTFYGIETTNLEKKEYSMRFSIPMNYYITNLNNNIEPLHYYKTPLFFYFIFSKLTGKLTVILEYYCYYYINDNFYTHDISPLTNQKYFCNKQGIFLFTNSLMGYLDFFLLYHNNQFYLFLFHNKKCITNISSLETIKNIFGESVTDLYYDYDSRFNSLNSFMVFMKKIKNLKNDYYVFFLLSFYPIIVKRSFLRGEF